MPIHLTIVTEADIRNFEQQLLDPERSRIVAMALENDERARACLRIIRSSATRQSRKEKARETNMTSDKMNATSKISQLKTGINNESVLADILTGCLADTYVLMIKTQGFHWNVAGPLFKSFHDLTEAHYENLFAAGDILAERVRALGYPAPYSIAEMLEASQIPEEDGTPNAAGMLKALISGHESTAKRFRNAVSEADDHHDVATVDLLTGRIAFHEKAVWMLKSMAA